MGARRFVALFLLALAAGLLLVLEVSSQSDFGRLGADAGGSARTDPVRDPASARSQPTVRAGSVSAGQPHTQGRTGPFNASVDPSLLKSALADRSGMLRFVVEMQEQASLASCPMGLGRREQRAWVVNALQDAAQSSQVGIRAGMEALQAEGHVAAYRSFWVFNGLAVTADGEALLALAARSDVAHLRDDRRRRWIPTSPDSVLAGPEAETGPTAPWNLTRIGAPAAWAELDLDGSGVVIAFIDTGADWQHPLLQPGYRGFDPNGPPVHTGNWICTTGEECPAPTDGNGHGTHVTGIAVGRQDAAGVAVGVAPGARWIAAKAFDDGGYAYDSWIHSAFEWVLAPGGDPTRAPDIVNGSWGSANAGDETFRPDLQALRAAGIVPVFAAGNDGPGASTVRSPASLHEAIAVGASDDVDQVPGFSGRGPSPWGEIKPELAAPGVMIRSSLPGGDYGQAYGTSSAAPHVAGAMALALQADPTLSVDQIEDLFGSTARPLGAPAPNNDAGWGRIDAHQAAVTALGGGVLAGRVTAVGGGEPVASAHVAAQDREGQVRGQAQTGPDGWYAQTIRAGSFDVTTTAFGFEAATAHGVSITVGMTTSLSFELAPLPTGRLWGTVTDSASGQPVEARVSALDTPAGATSLPQDGSFELLLPEGEYRIQFWRNGYRVSLAEGVVVVAGGSTRLDAGLEPAPTLLLVDSGPWYYGSRLPYLTKALDARSFAYDAWPVRHIPQDVPDVNDLAAFDVVLWSAPQDSPGLIGAGDVISSYLTGGGNLLLTGQDVGLWDGGLTGTFWAPYYTDLLQARALADDAGDGPVVGVPDDLLDGLTLPVNGPDSAQNQDWPDEIALADPHRGATLAGYAGDGDAALRVGTCLPFRSAYVAAGLEGLGDLSSRAETLDRLIGWLGSAPDPLGADGWPSYQAEVWLGREPVTYTWTLRNTGSAGDGYRLSLSPGNWPTTLWRGDFSAPLPPTVTLQSCEVLSIGVQVDVPADAGWNVTDAVTLTARSVTDPAVQSSSRLSTKTPAAVLVVDDHRWYEMLPRYRQALEAKAVPYDVWLNNWSTLPGTDNPGLDRLLQYPIVIWFTGFDWYSTLTPANESVLAAYLDAGGRLALTSQDYLFTAGRTRFAEQYLGVADFTEAFTATSIVAAAGHPAAQARGPLDLVYPFGNWSDALRPEAAARVVWWGQHSQPVAISKAQAAWRALFLSFPFEALRPPDMARELGAMLQWLSPLGDSSLEVDRQVAGAGEAIRCTLRLRNGGGTVLDGVVLSNTVPLSTGYVLGSLVGPAEYDPESNRFNWEGPLGAGEGVTIEYELLLSPDLAPGATIENNAQLEDERGLRVDLTSTTRIQTSNLSSSTQSASAAVAHPGESLTFTLVLRNEGLVSSDAVLTNPVPDYTSHEPGAVWASSGVVTSTADVVRWTGVIAPGQAVTITFSVETNPEVVGRYVLSRAWVVDAWGEYTMESFAWIDLCLYLPWIPVSGLAP